MSYEWGTPTVAFMGGGGPVEALEDVRVNAVHTATSTSLTITVEMGPGTEQDYSDAMGDLKDALESGGFTIPSLKWDGQVYKELDEV